MIILLSVMMVVIWFAVSMLCISYFNEHVYNSWDEWGVLPKWVRVTSLLFGPVLFIWWWVR
ncbi:hypothetical protein ACFQGA_18425 [Marinobacter koreensis]|uniref:Uncharacterized protein n=1 Tax=Marinobacter koreensis TaxID=335974 RepID=A0ABW0RRW1_9GAMM|nr:hypothetical protein [Marinobacter koreensis]MCK7549037.1 hypothetical protein [Marinobacter koreensis]